MSRGRAENSALDSKAWQSSTTLLNNNAVKSAEGGLHKGKINGQADVPGHDVT